MRMSPWPVYYTKLQQFRGVKGLVVKKYKGGGGGAFGNVVDKKHITHPPPPSAQKWLTHP